MREEHQNRIETRLALWKKQKGICVYCQKPIPYHKASLDHIIPVVYLEENIGPENLIMCCKFCNKNKLDHIIFTNLFDREIYFIIDIPVFFRYDYITGTKKIKSK